MLSNYLLYTMERSLPFGQIFLLESLYLLLLFYVQEPNIVEQHHPDQVALLDGGQKCLPDFLREE